MTKVLVVEDDPINMKLVFEILKLKGFTVHGAQNAVEVIRKIETELYDLILMDIELPDLDGIKLTKLIKDDPRYKNIPVIALTAYAMKGDKERILKAGLDGYIPKPIHLNDFMKKIDELVKNPN